MGDISRNNADDLADHDPTAGENPDQSTKDVERAPRLVVVAAALLAFVVCPLIFAAGQVGAGIAAVIAGLLAFGVGLDWLAMEGRRVRQADREWSASHPAR
jgi:hypothetical protein